MPSSILTDNGPQFSAECFAQFAQSYGFTHTTSSPRFPQANGGAERAVRILKKILKKNEHPHLALLMQRTTPLLNGLSPSQLLMGRRLRTRLPVIPSTLLPGVTGRDLHNAKAREAVQRAKQQQQFNSRYRATYITPLQPGDNVWVRDQDRYGTVVERAPQPRSYLVQTPNGVIRRNRSALVTTEIRQQIQRDDPTPTSTTPDKAEDPPATPSQSTTPPSSPRPTTAQSPGVTRTRSLRSHATLQILHPWDLYNEYQADINRISLSNSRYPRWPSRWPPAPIET